MILPGRTSVTDRDDWREFCAAAAEDLSLLYDWPPVVEDVIGPRQFAQDRYARIAWRIWSLFPGRVRSITELGGGYGGQAQLLMQGRPWLAYTIIDLIEPRRLQDSYLLSNGLRLAPYTGLPGDLWLSNYAHSELEDSVQAIRAREAVEHRCGYVTWNGWVQGGSRDDFRALFPRRDLEWIGDEEDERNDVLAWGHRR